MQVIIFYDGKYWTTLTYLPSDGVSVYDAVMELADLEGKDRSRVTYQVQPAN
jgi:hypothetical protein